MKNCFIAIISLFVVVVSNVKAQNDEPLAIIEKMLESIDIYNNLQGNLLSEERVGNSTQKNHIEFKLSNNPRLIYVKSIEPNNGVEILYNPDLYGSDRVYVNPNKFLLPNIKLSLQNRLLLDNRHHTINHLGFSFLKDVLIEALDRAGEQPDSVLTYKGIVQFDGKECFVLEIIDPTYSTKQYTVQEGETIFSAARKLLVSEYSIIEMNQNVNNLWDVSEGDVINVPTSYAPKTTLYVDTVYYLPIMQLMEDDNGLFEKYEFKNLKLTKSYASNEFEPGYEAYKY